MRRTASHHPWIEEALDLSILFSFDRSGYERHARRFRTEDLEVDLADRTCLVTGANSGLGEATARGLAERGAKVWMLCRDRLRGEAARRRLGDAAGSDRLRLLLADVAEMDSIDRVLEQLQGETIDLLVNNAGVLLPERLETTAGIEKTLATNLLGPARLTEGLVDNLRRSCDPRVINVSSGGTYLVSLETTDPEWRCRSFDGVRAYAETKRALVVLTELWARHYADSGILFHSMHPGWADTGGVRKSLPRFWRYMQSRLRTAQQGADTILWLAAVTPERLGSGRFWFDREAVSPHLLPWTRESPAERQQLWHLCHEYARAGSRRKEVA